MSGQTFSIGQAQVGVDNPVVIAEAGVNHLGDLEKAERLIAGAADAGCEVIKFQTYKARELTTRHAERFWSWSGESDPEGSQFDSYSALDSFGLEQYRTLREMCTSYGIEFMSTPFSPSAVDLLLDVGVGAFKIASCDITNKQLLEYIGSQGLPVLLSTGASTIDEIRQATDWLGLPEGDILIMHCTLTYPTPPRDANLSAIRALQAEFPSHFIGYSDHTLGPYIAAASTLFGACVIEKHFTYDKSLPLSADHWLSADIPEMTQLVELANSFALAQGNGQKVVLSSENLARSLARRSVVSARNIARGQQISVNDLAIKRPGTGLSPADFDLLLGAIALEDIPEDTLIEWGMVDRA